MTSFFPLFVGILLFIVTSFILYKLCAKLPFFADTAEIPTEKPSTPLPYQRLGSQLRIMTAQELIQFTQTQGLLQKIRDDMKLNQASWEKDALPFIERFMEFVQLTPASENHHHAQPGGLIIHTLEVAAHALRACQGNEWPPERNPEEKKRLEAAWRFGLLIAAILHDIGKPLVSTEITLFSEDKPDTPIKWIPEAGPMTLGKCYTWYKVDFPEKYQDYKLHTRLAWGLFQVLVPEQVRSWLITADTVLIEALRLYLSGIDIEKSHFYTLIKQADSQSTADNLKYAKRTRFSTAKRVPMIEILMQAARAICADRGFNLSIGAEAGGSIFRQGESIFVVNKPFTDAMRKYIAKETKHNLPEDTQRIFDTFLEYNAIAPNPNSKTKKAIMQLSVQPLDTNKPSMKLTVLHFKVQALYGDNHCDWPNEYLGEIEITDFIPGETSEKNSDKETKIMPPVSTAKIEANNTDKIVALSSQLKFADASTHINIEPTIQAITIEASHAIVIEKTEIENTEIEAVQEEEKTTTTTEMDAFMAFSSTIITPQHPTNAMIEPIIAPTPITTVAQSNTEKKENKPTKTTAKTNKPTPVLFGANSSNKKILSQLSGLAAPSEQNSAASPPPKKDHTPPMINQAGNNPEPHIEATSNIAPITPRPPASAKEIQRPPLMPAPVPAPMEHALLSTLDTVHPNSDQKIEAQNKLKKLKQQTSNPNPLFHEFKKWLVDGLTQDTLIYNRKDGRIHFVEEGMFICSPGIFTDFTGEAFDKMAIDSKGKRIQMEFERFGQVAKTEKGSTFHKLSILDEKDLPLDHTLTGYLIKKEALSSYIGSMPILNPRVKLKSE